MTEVARESRSYFRIRVYGPPATMLKYRCSVMMERFLDVTIYFSGIGFFSAIYSDWEVHCSKGFLRETTQSRKYKLIKF